MSAAQGAPAAVTRRGAMRRFPLLRWVLIAAIIALPFGLWKAYSIWGASAGVAIAFSEPPPPVIAHLADPPPATPPEQPKAQNALFNPSPPPPPEDDAVAAQPSKSHLHVVTLGTTTATPEAIPDRAHPVAFKPADVAGLGATFVAARDLTTTIKPTTKITLVLDGALDGALGGPLVAHVSRDVLAWDNDPRHPAIPAGTPVMGNYQILSQGQHRMAAVAAAAYLTDGRIVPLGGAPFTDDLGRIGMPGIYDARLWERFGNAILADVALMAISLPQTALQSQSNGINFYPQSTEGIVSQVLSTTINLPPLFYKIQGDSVSLVVIQPINVAPKGIR